VELRIDFVTENTTRKMNSSQKCNFIISKLKSDRVVVFEGGLDPNEEAILIEETMSQIDHENFLGYRIISPAPLRGPNTGLFSRHKDIKMTVIAPHNFDGNTVSLIDNEINLNRYQCALCGKTPEKAQEVFQGCICGHRLFRIVHQKKEIKSNVSQRVKKDPMKKMDNLNFLTVHELEVGIYDINVDKLFAGKSGKKDSTPVVVGNKGVFSIHLEHQKKKY
jgi:predicted  nucleic acid-binding Zn-ribbon protein